MTHFEKWEEMSERERLAYLAGFIDGEGSFSIGNSQYCSPIVSVSNTHVEPLELLSRQFGGDVREKNRYKNWKQCYGWSAAGRSVVPVIKALQPFLMIKQAQTEIHLALAETMGPGGREVELTDEVRLLRLTLADLLRDFDKKGQANESE